MSVPENPEFPTPLPGESGKPPRPPKITARGLKDDFPLYGSIIDNIAARMAARFPCADVKRGKDFITYFPFDADGFRVGLVVNEKAEMPYRIFYEGAWFDTSRRNAVIELFGLGLSTDCRVRESRCVDEPYRWIVELWDDGKKIWHPRWDVIHWRTAARHIFRRPMIRYLQNTLIDLRVDNSDASAAA